MPDLTDQQLADALQTIVAAISTNVPWNVVAVHGLGVVLAWDVQEEADAAVLEALSGGQGEVVGEQATESESPGAAVMEATTSAAVAACRS